MITKVRNYFNSDAEKFDDERWFYDPVSRAERRLRATLVGEALGRLRGISSPESIAALELGCGPGIWLAELSKYCGTVTGIDCSEKMLQRARAIAPTATLKCADFSLLLPVDDKSVDFLLMSHALEYVPDTTKLAAEIRRVCRPNAVVCIITKNRDAFIWKTWKSIADNFKSNPIPSQHWRSSEDVALNLNLNTQSVYGLFPRIPNKFNDVNDAWPNKRIRFYIGWPTLVSGVMLKLLSPFAWHIGIIATVHDNLSSEFNNDI
ncbi:class I SAM-dependent methyltransferase [Agrobacterium cavarae]|uniref:class I SAM-dependent methyltransferase n=1 Tax=Agrobacterium cavarae TaxID=2528239 RepID=UPI003CFDED2B